MTLPVAPELFDVLIQYAKDMEAGKIKPTRSMGSTSPALTFCKNFYAQFFQNRLDSEIKRFDREAREAAVRLRLQIKGERGPAAVIQLIAWYEELCDIYPDILALGYGVGGKEIFRELHDYLLTLLKSTAKWAADENYPSLEQKAQEALKGMRQGLKSIAK